MTLHSSMFSIINFFLLFISSFCYNFKTQLCDYWLFSPYPYMKDLSMVINTPELARNKKIQNTKVFCRRSLEMTPYPKFPCTPPLPSPSERTAVRATFVLSFLFILVFLSSVWQVEAVAYICYFLFHGAQRTCSLKCIISFSRRFFWMSFLQAYIQVLIQYFLVRGLGYLYFFLLLCWT